MEKGTFEKIAKSSSLVTIACAIVCIASVLVMVFTPTSTADDEQIRNVATELYQKFEERIDERSLARERENDSLRIEMALMKRRDSITQEKLLENNRLLFDINNKYNERFNTIDRFNVSDIERFLSDRY